MIELLSKLNLVALESINASHCAFTTNTESVDVSGYHRCAILLWCQDVGTAAVVTLCQGTTSTTTTALAFTKMFSKLDISTDESAWVETAVSSNTFSSGTSTKTALYLIDVDCDTLDKTAGSEAKYLRCNVATGTGGKGALLYIPYSPRYGTAPADVLAVH